MKKLFCLLLVVMMLAMTACSAVKNEISKADEPVSQESKEEEKDVIAEVRDRFFNIINRIEKLYD